jgi:hypothetical protein
MMIPQIALELLLAGSWAALESVRLAQDNT